MTEKNEIKICECGTPLIWTFAFNGCEYYCVNCGYGAGMMGAGRDVKATRELKFKYKLAKAVWDVIYSKKGFASSSGQRTGCEKCRDNNEAHRNHLTKAESEWDDIARKYLKSIQGFLTK